MKRWLLHLYPKSFRRRYEDELIDLLDDSARPVRDVLDVAVHAGQLRGEQLMTNAARYLADLSWQSPCLRSATPSTTCRTESSRFTNTGGAVLLCSSSLPPPLSASRLRSLRQATAEAPNGAELIATTRRSWRAVPCRYRTTAPRTFGAAHRSPSPLPSEQ